MIKYTLLLSWLGTPALLWGASVSISVYDYRKNSNISLPLSLSHGEVLVVFKEDCLPCRKQLRDLSCLSRQRVKLLGVGRDRLKLKHIAAVADYQRLYNASFKAAGDAGFASSPSILFRSKKRQKNLMISGYVPCQELVKFLD